MALTAEEQELLDFALAGLPHWFQDDNRPAEYLGAAAKVIGDARAQADYWFEQSRILDAVGVVGSEPDWLNQHAIDRGTARQDGETDAELRERLRNVPDALTRPTLLAAADAILAAEGNPNTSDMVELRRDKAFFRTSASDSGTGGEFIGTAPDMRFVPDAPGYATPPFRTAEEDIDHRIVISGAAAGGNDGTFDITGLQGDGAEFQNGAGVAGVDATASWTIEKLDRDGNLLDGFKDSYLSRGDRMSGRIPTVLIILPYNCTEGTRLSTLEMMRQKKGAGVRGLVECMDGLNWPQTAAALSTALTGSASAALADSIYQFNQASGTITDLVGSDDLTPTASPTQGVISKPWGSTVITFADASLERAVAAGAGVHDFTTGSWALLGEFLYLTPPAGTANLLAKFGGGFGYAIMMDPTGTTSIDALINGAGGLETVSVSAGGGSARFDDGKRHFWLLVRNTTAGDLNLYTTLGDGLNAADTAGDLTNTGIYSVGSDGAAATAGGELVPYNAVFSGAAAEALDTPTALSNFHAYLGLGGL